MPLPRSAAPVPRPHAPGIALPKGACDAHVHMLGSEFALWDGRVEDPAPGTLDDWAERLETHLDTLGLDRVVIVHTILYGGDNSVTQAAIARLGDRARGIGLVTDAATEADLDALAETGIRGVRLNYIHGGILSWDGVRAMAPRLAARDMHVQMLIQADLHMSDLAAEVRALPVPVVFDHIGWPNLAAGVTEPGFDTLRGLVADGAAHVKLSGLYRLCGAPYDAAATHIDALARANPEGCLWASDWPHLMLADATRPDAGILLQAFLDVVTDDATREVILTRTPERLYGFSAS
ncbi:amidohydrolase [Jannaschia sp. M317]|uniref:amidohydrolase family protein n=1 Tax=Jannaschia sp. M317 TaxID=2867011 RepID=UPI0021A585B3|nr:amidohydrolase family protein [Jannaschia sp. M317]UWQ19378.1 amidohydrolase family protein [Jannaschia sp. M317]